MGVQRHRDHRIIADERCQFDSAERAHDVTRTAGVNYLGPVALLLRLLPAMADVAAEMVHDVLTAYAARDAALAREVIAQDKKVDAFYNSIFRNLVSHMVENPATISSAAQLLFVARNIERIGDHATNVAEMVYFAATGDYPLDEDEN